MSDDLGERMLDPTARRRREARQAGQVARSGDLVSVLVLGGTLAAVGLAGPGLLAACERMLAGALSAAGPRADAGELLGRLLPDVLWAATPLLAAAMALAVAANVLQVGWTVSAQAVAPNFERLSVSRNMGRLWSLRTLETTGLSLLKIAAVGAIGGVTIWDAMPRITRAAMQDARGVLATLGGLVADLATCVGLALLVLAVLDYGFQRWQHERDLKMSRRERLEELRQSEGDPQARRRMRDEHGQLGKP